MTTPAIPEAGTLPWLDRYTSTSGEIMTEAGVTPAQLLEFGREWERRCWPILAEAVGEVETLRAEVARLTKQRDAFYLQLNDARHETDQQRAKRIVLRSKMIAVEEERDQARADLAALHAEAARLATDRDRAHELVDELMAERNAALDERDHARTAAANMRQARNEAQAERSALGPLIDAVLKFVEVEARRSPAMGNCSAWLEEQKVRRAALIAAVDQMAPSRPQVPPRSDDRGEVVAESGSGASGGSSVLDDAMASVWLHGDWRWLTRNMTTEEKTAAADAVDRHYASSRVERWWLDV